MANYLYNGIELPSLPSAVIATDEVYVQGGGVNG
jgi:hypothetical protein